MAALERRKIHLFGDVLGRLAIATAILDAEPGDLAIRRTIIERSNHAQHGLRKQHGHQAASLRDVQLNTTRFATATRLSAYKSRSTIGR